MKMNAADIPATGVRGKYRKDSTKTLVTAGFNPRDMAMLEQIRIDYATATGGILLSRGAMLRIACHMALADPEMVQKVAPVVLNRGLGARL